MLPELFDVATTVAACPSLLVEVARLLSVASDTTVVLTTLYGIGTADIVR